MRDNIRLWAFETAVEPKVLETEKVSNGYCFARCFMAFSLQPKHLSSYDPASFNPLRPT